MVVVIPSCSQLIPISNPATTASPLRQAMASQWGGDRQFFALQVMPLARGAHPSMRNSPVLPFSNKKSGMATSRYVHKLAVPMKYLKPKKKSGLRNLGVDWGYLTCWTPPNVH